MKKITKIWKCKNGTRIRICDMTDSHLINTIKLLYKTAIKNHNYSLCCFPSFQGEMAQYYAEQEWDALNEMDSLEFCEREYPIFEDLTLEAERRKLDLKFLYE